ncbi:hypothetical protein BGX30_008353 [Mortierella sp. GBA39]|nr:hypothetical protein BGX30_008353 [Mortierella sp. GBA39]
MIQLKDIGKFKELPAIAMHIYQGNIPALRDALAEGWDMEEGIVLSRYTALSPLDLAVIAERLDVVKLLVEHGVNLNDAQSPAFLRAVRYGKEEMVRYIAEQGARMDMLNRVGSGAYSQAYYGNKSNIPLIQELGLDIKQHGGAVLRQAVSDHDYKTLNYLLDQGVDINYNQPDQVYPYEATPLTVAARIGNFDMVKYLIERGADVTLAEKDGERPYTIALAPNEYDIRHIDFFTLTDTIPVKIGRQKLLRLSADIDNYSDLQLMWNPKKKGWIGCYDVEHDNYSDLCRLGEFLEQPDSYLVRFLDGEL